MLSQKYRETSAKEHRCDVALWSESSYKKKIKNYKKFGSEHPNAEHPDEGWLTTGMNVEGHDSSEFAVCFPRCPIINPFAREMYLSIEEATERLTGVSCLFLHDSGCDRLISS